MRSSLPQKRRKTVHFCRKTVHSRKGIKIVLFSLCRCHKYIIHFNSIETSKFLANAMFHNHFFTKLCNNEKNEINDMVTTNTDNSFPFAIFSLFAPLVPTPIHHQQTKFYME